MSRRKRRSKAVSPTSIDAASGELNAPDVPSIDETVAPELEQSPDPEQSPDSVLNIKVSPAADVDSTLERLHHVEGFRAIEPLFPGETHPDLSTIYVAHVDSERVATTKTEIEADEDIEYVDEAPTRRLTE